MLAASLIIIAVALILGALLGGKNAPTSTATSLVTARRFGSLGLIIIGSQLNGDPNYLGPAIVFTMLDFVLPFILAIEIGRKHSVATPA